MDAAGKWEYVEVLGKWDEGIVHKVAADAIAVHGHFRWRLCAGRHTGPRPGAH
jgi:ribose transport system substrate-binding protein